MKLSLQVCQGKTTGQVIRIPVPQFSIGRDPKCHLRPASSTISKNHCLLLMREDKAFLKDLDSTNGTFLNNEQLKGEAELHNGDHFKIGPLEFAVVIESSEVPVDQQTPVPRSRSSQPLDDEAVADMLLTMQDESGQVDLDALQSPPSNCSTILDLNLASQEEPAATELHKPPEAAKPAASAAAHTANAAEALLAKYSKKKSK